VSEASDRKDDILAINTNKLDEDAAEQPRTLRQWADKLSFAEKRAKLAKRKLRVVKAELSKVVRQSPSKYGIFRVTDTAIEDAVVMMSAYKAEEEELISAELARDLLKNMVISLHERGEEIGNLVKLHGQQYWARVRVDPDTMQEIQEHSRKSAMRKSKPE
jgi:hypothetical protein